MIVEYNEYNTLDGQREHYDNNNPIKRQYFLENIRSKSKLNNNDYESTTDSKV